MNGPRITRAMATRQRRIPPLLRKLGTRRHAGFRRNDDTFVRSNPGLMRQIEESRREIAQGRGVPFTIEQLRAELGLAE